VTWAAGNGDRSENGDYIYSKRRLREIDRRIRFFRGRPLLNDAAADDRRVRRWTHTSDFVRAGSLEDLRAKGRLVVHGRHRPVLLVQEDGQVFGLDNRCPHMGFPLDRGSVEAGILTCHWHHARFELASGCRFDLWADDVPICPVEIRAGAGVG
jgi:nitrite reductase/ring-hydroxylating ferredoxin subunit